jgi:hypothetical protein
VTSITRSVDDGTDSSKITNWTCPAGWIKSTTPGMCTPVAVTSLPDINTMICDTDFVKDPSSNRCIPGPTPIDSTKPAANLCPTDAVSISRCPASTPIVRVRSGGSQNQNYISITGVGGIETTRITVSYRSEQAFTDAYVFINADFTSSLFSNASQNITVNISEGDGSFTVDTHVSTWEMYDNKSVTIYDSSGTTRLSNIRRF